MCREKEAEKAAAAALPSEKKKKKETKQLILPLIFSFLLPLCGYHSCFPIVAVANIIAVCVVVAAAAFSEHHKLRLSMQTHALESLCSNLISLRVK